jgi:hypothetical protein
LLVHAQFLAELCQLVRCGAAFQVIVSLVLHERIEGDPSVLADLPARDLS